MARIFNARLFVIAFFGFILALFLFLRLNANEKPTTEKKTVTIANDYLVQSGLNQFQQRNSPTLGNCNGATSDYHCVYRVTEEGKENIPDDAGFNSDQIQDYLDSEWLEPQPGSSTNVYTGP